MLEFTFLLLAVALMYWALKRGSDDDDNTPTGSSLLVEGDFGQPRSFGFHNPRPVTA